MIQKMIQENVMLPRPMRACDFRCLLCGTPVGLKFEELVHGENSTACPMCNEPFSIKLDPEDIERFMEAEESAREEQGR
jgi:DNA-directed RNA polymerase subunit RPC12/RpoP